MTSICSTCKHYKGEVDKNKITFDGVEDGVMFFKDITSKLDLVYCDKNICGIPVAQSALTLTQCPHWEVYNMTNEELIKYIRDNIPVNTSEELKEKIDELEENIIELEEEIKYFRHGGDVG